MEWADYITVVYFIPLMLVGLIVHFLKKKIKGESFHEVKCYFTTHRVSTLASFLSGVLLLYIFQAMDQLSVVSAILSGYATDSLFQSQINAAAPGGTMGTIGGDDHYDLPPDDRS
jgi:hypothetical protein